MPKKIDSAIIRKARERAKREPQKDEFITVKCGDMLPKRFEASYFPGIKITKDGLAAADWCKAWCKAGGWGANCWGKCYSDTVCFGPDRIRDYIEKSPLRTLTDEQLIERGFSLQDLEILRRYGLRSK